MSGKLIRTYEGCFAKFRTQMNSLTTGSAECDHELSEGGIGYLPLLIVGEPAAVVRDAFQKRWLDNRPMPLYTWQLQSD